MRAQSVKDSIALNSDRPDHGPLGAFDGWPPGTMDALVTLGFPQRALGFYRNVAPVTTEGSWSQARELWGENKYNKNGRVRIATRNWICRDATCGIAFSQVMLKNFMGFYPQIDKSEPIYFKNNKMHFDGTMYNVLYGGKYYNISSNDGTVKVNR